MLDAWNREALYQERCDAEAAQKPRDVSRTGRPDADVRPVTFYSPAWDTDIRADVEVEADGCSLVLRARFAEGGLRVELNEQDDRRARELAAEEQ